VWTLTAIAIVFLVVSAGVIALARSTTARWERERRAAPAAGREVTPPRARVAARLRRAGAGAAATGRPVAVPSRVLLRARQTLARSQQPAAPRGRQVPHPWQALRRGRAGHGPGALPRRTHRPAARGVHREGEEQGSDEHSGPTP
jgi:hypothetical protein